MKECANTRGSVEGVIIVVTYHMGPGVDEPGLIIIYVLSRGIFFVEFFFFSDKGGKNMNNGYIYIFVQCVCNE